MHSAKDVLSVDETVSTVLDTRVPECTCYKIVKGKPLVDDHPKMNEIEAFVEELSQMHFKFSLMCFQECCLSDNDDKSHLQIDGYDCITQGKTCGNNVH